MNASPRLPAGVTVFERGWLSSNNVLFASGACAAIVDTGYVTHAPQTLALVRQMLGGRPLDLIVNTHLHSDHCGGNAALQSQYPGARTLIPPGLAHAVRAWDEDALTYTPTGQRCERFAFDDLARPGDIIELGESQWQVHAAPGHDPHSVILFEPRMRALISADALWENGFGVVFPELEGEDGFAQVGSTLDVIEALDPETVIPGHGRVFGGKEEIAAALARARSRLDGLAGDPRRHAAHGVKVLIKFRLLEWQTVELARLLEWAAATRYVRIVHQRFFSGMPMEAWLEDLAAQLVRSGALARKGGVLYNI
jgi:glyoxylase-like metal-dependent hydrolase (beta-lactamase superfamily II)